MTAPDRANEIADLLSRLAVLMAQQPAPETPQPRSMPERVLLTVDEAAERLNIGKTKAYALVKSNELESVNIGRLRRIHVDAVKEHAARLAAKQADDRPAA
jgi:excisionase family DNA binding protein